MKNLFGKRYNHLVSTAELHFYRSFQRFPHLAIFVAHGAWPYGHKWLNMAEMVIFGHLAIGPHATNMAKWVIPEKSYSGRNGLRAKTVLKSKKKKGTTWRYAYCEILNFTSIRTPLSS